MAENKKSFVLYADMIATVRKMPKGKQAELFMTILEYVNDENPVVEDLIVGLVWEPIKLQLKRDLVKYETFRSKQKENGKKGGRPPIENETQINPNNPSLNLGTQKSLTVICNSVLNDNDIVAATPEDEFEKLDHRGKKIFEMMRRSLDRLKYSDTLVILEVNKFLNRYPETMANNSGALVNTWCQNMAKPVSKSVGVNQFI